MKPDVLDRDHNPARRTKAQQGKRRPCHTMRIPHTKLSTATLRAVVQAFVTRDGTDQSPVERRIESVLRQLESGRAELHFDDQTETCDIVPIEADGSPPTHE